VGALRTTELINQVNQFFPISNYLHHDDIDLSKLSTVDSEFHTFNSLIGKIG